MSDMYRTYVDIGYDLCMVLCDICRRRQMPVSNHNEMGDPVVQTTNPSFGHLMRCVPNQRRSQTPRYKMYLKSVSRSQKGSLLYIKRLQSQTNIVSVQNTITYMCGCEYQYKELTIQKANTNIWWSVN